jgi:hypothetical protein
VYEVGALLLAVRTKDLTHDEEVEVVGIATRFVVRTCRVEGERALLHDRKRLRSSAVKKS